MRRSLTGSWWGGRLLLFSVALAMLAAACTTAPRTTREPAPASPAANAAERAPSRPAVAPASGAGVVEPPSAQTAEIVRQAYQEITGQLFKQLSPRELLVPAWNAVRDEAKRQGIIAFDLAPFIAAGSDDIDGFVREFTRLVNGLGTVLDATRVEQAAIRGMAAAVGDSHTRFLTPDQAESQRRAADGGSDTYSGIGIVIDASAEGVTIAEVYKGSPAERAGLRAGDRIVRVNGREIETQGVGDISAQVRGPEGSEINLTVQRLNEGPVDVTMSRARIILPNLPVVSSSMLEADIGYIRIRSFPRASLTLDAARDFDAQLLRLVEQGARGVVLDLRGNPGGDPLTSVAVASNFVQKGPIFVSIDRDGRRTVYGAKAGRTVFDGPVAVLIDRGTASGAEVVASAIQEYGTGYLLGVRSCGCLSVGRPVQLGDNSGLVVTVEQAVTGKTERSLEGVGITPDESVRPALAGAGDPQRERAVTYVRTRLQ